MAVVWQLFPRSGRPVPEVRLVVEAFELHDSEISSEAHTRESNGVLQVLASTLEAGGFVVERGKTVPEKILVPVLFGENGRVEKSFNADAFHPDAGVVLEVEAGRAVDNNQWLKDLFQACMMQDALHLVIAVRKRYRGGSDYAKVFLMLDTLYSSQRLHLPLKSVTLLGY